MSLFNGGLNFSRIKKLFQKNQSSKLGDKWNRTDDLYGHAPVFPINCGHCGEKMMLRYTEILPERSRNFAINEGINNIAYKCPRCHKMDKFFIPDDTWYLNEILNNKRDGIGLYLPPKKEWEKENKEIKERLKALGYM